MTHTRAPGAPPHPRPPALYPRLPTRETPRGVIRPENPTARLEAMYAHAFFDVSHPPPDSQPSYTSLPSYTSMANRMTTRSSSFVRTPSPVGSESSDFYYDDPVFDSAFTSPPRAADKHNTYDSDASEAMSTDAHNATPTLQPTRAMSTASVVEITMDERPATPVDAAPAKRGKAGKKNKGKKRAAQALAVAASLGQTTILDHATGGASSSHRLPESPSKRIRTNPRNDAAHAAHPGTSAAGSPFLTPMVNTASNTAVQPNTAVTAPAIEAPSGAPALDAAQTLATGASTHATFAAVVAAPAPVFAAPTPAIAAPAPVIAGSRPRHRSARRSAEAIPVGPVWTTADGHPPRGSYAPHPTGRLPCPGLLLRAPHPGHASWPHAASSAGGNGTTIQTHGLIRVAIGDFLNVDPTSFHLGTPPDPGKRPQPRALAGSRTTPTPSAGRPRPACPIFNAALRYSPSRSTCPSLDLSAPLAASLSPNSQGGADTARNLLQTAIRANVDINEFVRTHRDAFGPQVSADQAWHIFTNSVAVEGMELLVNNH
ncbi:hypothetical protein B0H14DRAFT_3499062 [Mycena olivaceomarginata]|nr:hypothetical protein B0H14DRAFT_3499062 [Mycena olivaceomarginata]